MEKDFIQIIDKHQGIIHKVSRMYRDSLQDQEDLFQEIIYQLWKSYPKFRNESKVSTWIYRISLNVSIAIYRKKKLNVSSQDQIEDKYHPLTENESSENEELLYWALRQLRMTERAIISLHLEDYSYGEIADIIGITENYVGVQINRIKNKLKLILNQ